MVGSCVTGASAQRPLAASRTALLAAGGFEPRKTGHSLQGSFAADIGRGACRRFGQAQFMAALGALAGAWAQARTHRTAAAALQAANVSAAVSRRRRIRPGRVSAAKTVPEEIQRPPYLLPGSRTNPRTGMPAHPFMHFIEVKSGQQVDAMRAAGALAREALEVAGRAVAPGVTTDAIDAVVHDFAISRGAYPSPLGYMGFPKSVSTSVNDIIAHGIPDDRPLEDGDIVNIDVTLFVGGHHGDTSSMFLVGRPEASAVALCQSAQQAMMAGIEICGPGVDFREIGKRIEGVAGRAGCHVSPHFSGHGIGSYFHGAPEVIPCSNDLDQGLMLPGMTFTVEPILVEDFDDSYTQWDDNWTVQTLTNARSAQFEHTILITDHGHEILTGPSIDYEALAG